MHHVLRRTAVIVASSAVVLAGAPLLNSAFADTALTQSSVTPTNAQTVKNSHPTISASYTDNAVAANLDPSSTITVTKSATSIGCTSVVSGNTITCNYSGLLTAGSYSIVIHAVEAANTAKTADNTTTFTVNVPVIQLAAPAAGDTVAALPNSGSVRTQYNQHIDDSHSTITVQQIADRQPDGTYAPASHTPLTGTTDFTSGISGTTRTKLLTMADANQNDTIVFTPSSQPVNKGIYQVTLDVFGTDGAGSSTQADQPVLTAETKDVYTFILDNTPPAGATDLAVSPTPVTNANKTTISFNGKAKPGNTITVDVFDGGSGHKNNTTPAPVPSAGCSSSTSCPWSVTLDLTALADGTLTWKATEASSVGSTQVNGPSFLKDTTAPANANVHGSFSPSNSTTLHVTGSSDSTVDHYTLDIHDAATPTNHTIPQITLTKAANGGVASDGTFVKDVDVSSLDDGTITMSIVAYDALGNHTAIPATGTATSTATKAVGLVLDFNDSFFKQSNSDTPSFPDVLARPSHAVQHLSQVVIEFSNPLTLQQNDTTLLPNKHSFPAPNPYFVEILPNGADGNTFGGTDVVGSDNRQLVITPPAGLADGTYKLHITAYQGPNPCEFDSTPAPGPAETESSDCTAYNDFVKVPNTTDPFTFTVDSQAPTAPVITTIPAGTIDGSNVGDVEIKVTGEPGSMVTLTAKSSGGGSVLVLNQGQPVTLGNDGKGTDDEDNSALAVLPDGTLTITGTPTDAAGNTGTAGTGTVSLAARPSIPRSLAVSQSSNSFTLHWAAPSYDGYSPPPTGSAIGHLTGYRYTYQDTTAGAVDTSVHTVSVDNPSATSATQSALLVGHSYVVTLCAVNNISGPCNTVSTTARPAYFTGLTAKVSKALVVYGNPITLSGRLTRTDIGAGVANKSLKVTPHYDNGTTGTVLHPTTNSLGNWSLTIAKPSKNALYVVTFNDTHADATYQPSNASVRSLVAVSLRIDKVTWNSTSHTAPITVLGHISPNQSGRSVLIYARSAAGTRYQRIGSAKISSKGTWSFTKTFGAGKFYLYATFPSQNGNVGGSSQSVNFTRS